MQYKLDNLPYEVYEKFKNRIIEVQIPIIKSADETLDKIINDKCSMTRFGDGEFACMNLSRIAYHDPSEELAQRLKEVISSNLPNLLIGLPDCFGSLDAYVLYTRKFWRKYMSKKRQMTYSYLNMNRVYYNAFLSRCYRHYNKTDKHHQRCCTYFKKLKEIWEDRDVVICESQEAQMGVANDLLDGAKKISRMIFCPPRNAFYKYDEILSAFNDISTDNLILAALGPTATVLAHDLCIKGYQAIDIGDINGEYECFLKKETPLELRFIGKSIKRQKRLNPDNLIYKKQIIKTLT